MDLSPLNLETTSRFGIHSSMNTAVFAPLTFCAFVIKDKREHLFQTCSVFGMLPLNQIAVTKQLNNPQSLFIMFPLTIENISRKYKDSLDLCSAPQAKCN